MLFRRVNVEKPTPPTKPKLPEILEGSSSLPGISPPEEYFDHIIFQTKTNFDIALEKFKKDTPNPSREEIVKHFQQQYYWDVEYNNEGGINRIYSDRFGNDPKDFETNAHSSSGSKPFSLSQIMAQVDPSDYDNVMVKGVANYKGDYIWGDPGVCVFIRKRNPRYEEQTKAFQEYREKEMEYFKQEGVYNKKLQKYEAEREQKIAIKIKEMEENGEL